MENLIRKIDVLPGIKTFIVCIVGVILTLVSVDGGTVALNELTPERIETILQFLGIGTIRLAIGR